MEEGALLLLLPSPSLPAEMQQERKLEEAPLSIQEDQDQTLEAPLVVVVEEEEESTALSSHEDQTLEDFSISEHKTSRDQDQKPVDTQEIDDITSIIQTLKDDDIIPPAALDAIPMGSFPAPDLSSALHHLGFKHNTLIKKYQERNSELGVLGTQIETLRKKCLEECEPKYETLMRKYTEVWSERKRLYNEVIELKGNIRVFCRCRPLSLQETSKGYSSIVDFDPSQDTELQIISSEISRKQFKFDHVFGPQDNQEAVFAETLPFVKSVLDGYNACIFAYGQTGTGKTFTMEGTAENRGVNYRTLEELFSISEERSSVMKYEFFVSMLEVYNEKIRDLLAENSNQPTKKLEVKQTTEGTQEVPGLVEAQAYSTGGVWELLKTGGQNRSVGSTNANELSSRSHSLVRVTVKGENLVNGQRIRSHLWLVDLAGSERVGKIDVEGERLKESQFINKSLSALGDVIAALASKNPHIPYRNSKLTHLLQSSLGGDCKTLMFVQISPSSADLGETLCSLNFATRVRGIEQGPARKHSDPTESFKYKQMAEKLRQEEKESARLNESLQLMHLKYASRENVFRTLQEKIRDLESQLADERKARFQQETKESAKYQKPPLPPIMQRRPLSRITNNFLPPSGPRRSNIATKPARQDKENISAVKRYDNTAPVKPLMRARRISLAPVVRPTAVQQPRRRTSIAVMPCQIFSTLPNEARKLQQNNGNNNAQLSSSLMRDPRRRSITAYTPLPKTPLAATSTPEWRGKARRSIASSSKFFSPPPMQSALWKSKIPTIASPRQRFRLLSSPLSQNPKNTQAVVNKLCFSVQKRLVISSPAQPQHAMVPGATAMNQALQDKEIVGKFGTAQRILCKNRRKSVM